MPFELPNINKNNKQKIVLNEEQKKIIYDYYYKDFELLEYPI